MDEIINLIRENWLKLTALMLIITATFGLMASIFPKLAVRFVIASAIALLFAIIISLFL